MPRKRRYTTEQIITKLREADVLLSQGKTAEEISRVLEISKQTYYRWRKVTCPPKTDPEVMLGSVHTGGRKDGKTHTVYTGADHHQIAGS
jgi:hypothetical protein